MRIATAAAFAIGLFAALSLLDVLAGGCAHADQAADNARLAAVISEKLAALNVKPRTVELTVEKAARTRRAIEQGDYATAGSITSDVLADSEIERWRYHPFTTFIEEVPDLHSPDFEAHLTEWILRNPDDALPLLFRARYYYLKGWFASGRGFSADAQKSRNDTFRYYMGNAGKDVADSLKLRSDIPYTYHLQLLILLSRGASGEMTDAFEQATEKYPNYYSLYAVMLDALQPKWGGSVAEMYQFVDKHAGGAATNAPLKLLYVHLYSDLLNAAWVSCNAAARGNGQMPPSRVAKFLAWFFGRNTTPSAADAANRPADCIGTQMAKIVTPKLEHNVQQALALYDHTDKRQFDLAIGPLLASMLNIANGRTYGAAMLQLAANAMHTDTRLREEDMGPHDYMIDRTVAASWFDQNFYQNALTKYREALKTARSTIFSDEEERDLALASIYERIADTYYLLHQYTDTIAAEEAAMALDARVQDTVSICASYDQLNDYDDAIAACNEAVNGTDSLNSRYWRGLAYNATGRSDEAAKDFATVADSESNFRTSAAISLTMIYFGRNDVTSAMDVYAKHPYLFDPRTQRKDDLAVNYNNRCYAYMQLGELQKALDDCTQSLKYDSLPDAVRKQQELVKRLKAP